MKKVRVKLIVKEFYKQMNPDIWDGSGERPDSFDTHAWEYPLTKSGYCPDCQKALFGTEYDRSDFIIVDDIEDGEVPEDVKKFLEAAEKMNVKDVIKSETANILTTEHKVVLLSEFDLEDIFYVDDDGNIKDR